MGVHSNLAEQGWFYLPGHSIKHPRIVSYQDANKLASSLGYRCRFVIYKPNSDEQPERFALTFGPYILLPVEEK